MILYIRLANMCFEICLLDVSFNQLKTVDYCYQVKLNWNYPHTPYLARYFTNKFKVGEVYETTITQSFYSLSIQTLSAIISSYHTRSLEFFAVGLIGTPGSFWWCCGEKDFAFCFHVGCWVVWVCPLLRSSKDISASVYSFVILCIFI